MCPFPTLRQPTVVSRMNGRRLKLPLGVCSICGLGGHAGADVLILAFKAMN